MLSRGAAYCEVRRAVGDVALASIRVVLSWRAVSMILFRIECSLGVPGRG